MSGGIQLEPVIGYVIPEFPGQTHIWIWREIVHLREWGTKIHLFSTRRLPVADQARHQFAEAAIAETTYLSPIGLAAWPGLLLWMLAHPAGLVRCIALAFSLPLDKKPAFVQVLPLIPYASRMARDARRLGITRMHAHSCASSAVLCMLVRRLVGIPFSMTLNANIDWWGGAMREKLADAEFTTFITRWLLDQARRDFPDLPESKLVRGLIGVDTRKWVPEDRLAPRDSGRVKVVTLGRLHESKGHDDLLRAIKVLVDQGIDVGLELVGDGPDRNRLESLTDELGLLARVRFLGSLGEHDVMRVLRGSDVFALASHAEPLGVVYMEAMALELATIGTAAGGVGEIIDSGDSGILVPPRDPAALAAAIRNLVEEPALRERIAARGRQAIIERFDSRIGAAMLYRLWTGRDPIGADVPASIEATPAALPA